MSNKQLAPIREQINNTLDKFKAAYNKDAAQAKEIFEKEKGFAMMAIMNNSQLLSCSKESFYTAVAQVALTGLTLNPTLQLAYLVPRGGKACLDISYKGMIEVLTGSDSIKAMRAAVVYDCDEFDYCNGIGDDYYLKHKPVLNRSDDAEFIAVYSVAVYTDGHQEFHVMDRKTILKHRNIAKTKRVWDEWFDEMAKKTVIRQHYKFLPKTQKATKVMEAFDSSNPVDLDSLEGNEPDISVDIPYEEVTDEQSGQQDMDFDKKD